MGLNIAPAFRIEANSADITAKIRDRFVELSLTDETGVTADTLEIVLADHLPDQPIEVPPTGAELRVWIGYEGEVIDRGLFVADEIELAGAPGRVIIRARAAPFEQSKGGKVDLQTQKTRSWVRGTTIGGMVKKIAGEHGMTPRVAAALASITLPHIDQASESDMNLLARIAKRHDAVVKPAGGALVFAVRGSAEAAGGAAMPRVVLTPADGRDYRVTIASRESAGTCIAYYNSVRKAKRHEITVGEGEPVKRLRMTYPDAAAATAAARAELRKSARSERTMAFTIPGRAELGAECIVELRGFRDGVDGEWLTTSVTHRITKGDGFVTEIAGELPNAADGPKAAAGRSADDSTVAGTAVDAP